MAHTPRRTLLLAVLAALAGVATLNGQPAGPAFDAAAVRENTSGEIRYGIQALPGGRLRATNVPVRVLIAYAYQLQPYQFEGGPDWIQRPRFDVVATSGADVSNQDVRLRLRTLLAERFKLVSHMEPRELPTYLLLRDRADGRVGPQLRQSAADCTAVVVRTEQCGFFGPAPGVAIRQGQLAFRGMTIEALARSLVPMVLRPIVDRTELDGYFDGELSATAELPPPPPPPGVPDPIDRQNLPSVFTVLKEQLGLKLEPARGTVDVFIIDNIERPAPE